MNHSSRKSSLATLGVVAAFVVFVIVICLLGGFRVYGQAAPATQPATQPMTQPAPTAVDLVTSCFDVARDAALGIIQQQQQQLAARDLTIATLRAQLAGQVPAGMDVGALLPPAKGKLMLAPAAVYPCNNTPVITLGGGGVLGPVANPAILNVTPAKGASSGIVVQAANCEIGGLTINGPAPVNGAVWGTALRVYAAGAKVHDSAFAGFDGAILLDAGADGATIDSCQFGILGSESIYITADHATISNSSFAGSIGEHLVRLDLNASTNHRPANARIVNCIFTNRAKSAGGPNGPGKECLTAREVDTLTVTGCTFDGWCSAGQSSHDVGIWHARHLTFDHCTWMSVRPGGALVQLEHDCDASFVACTFPASASEPAIVVNENCHVTATDCVLVGTTAGKGLIGGTAASGATISETGTIFRFAAAAN